MRPLLSEVLALVCLLGGVLGGVSVLLAGGTVDKALVCLVCGACCAALFQSE